MSPLRVAMVSSRYPPHLGGVETHVYEVARRMAARGLDRHRAHHRPHRRTATGGARWTTDRATVCRVAQAGRSLHLASPRPADRQGRLRPRPRAGCEQLPAPYGTRRRPAVGGTDGGHLPHRWSLQPCADDGQGGAVASPATPAPPDEGAWSRCVISRSRSSPDGSDSNRRRIRLIRNGAEPLPVGDSVPGISGSPLVCSVARLERYKGHHRLIAAMPALLELAPDAHLAVIGRGSYEPQLRRLVARLQVEHAVTFTSFDATQREALGALLRSSDVVALMSDYEANPVAVMEALALGRKVVVADTSGLSELASEGLATAVPPNASPRVLAGVLARVAAASRPGAPRPADLGRLCRPAPRVCTRRSFHPPRTAEGL